MAANGTAVISVDRAVAGTNDSAACRHFVFASLGYCLERFGFHGIYLADNTFFDSVSGNCRRGRHFAAAFPKAVLLFTGDRTSSRANAAGTGKTNYPFRTSQDDSGRTEPPAESSNQNALAAKEAEQRKNDLIVYLAHDLKTPLTSVIGYLSLLQDEPEISQELRAKYTGIALNKARRLEELINQFFEITRFQLTHMELEWEMIHFSRMLEQTAFEFQPILEEKHLQLQTEIAPDVKLTCDPDKLERVVDNLIRNAISYSYPNTAISLEMHTTEEYAVLTICNTGRTISPEKLDRIFEQFFRGDSSRATATGGAGLGLAIAKQITELHGGTIKADSRNEQIRFTVTLPLRQKIV